MSCGIFGQVGDEILSVEWHEDWVIDLASEPFDDCLVLAVVAVAPSVIGGDNSPALAEILVGPRCACGGEPVGVSAGAEAVARSFFAGRLGRLSGREIDGLELGSDRDGREHDARMHRAGHERRAIALNERTQLAHAGGGIHSVSSVTSSTLRPAMPPPSLISFVAASAHLLCQ